MASYWETRQAKAQANLTNKNVKETQKQLRKYYKKTFEKTLDNFEKTYLKILQSIEEGKEPTPADLYKLDTYWELQNQLTKELQELGDKQITLLSKQFMNEYMAVYDSFAIKGIEAFKTLDTALAKMMINEIWCADGKSWSDRIWTNSKKLQQALNDRLITCAIAGTPSGELKKHLMEEFDVSYGRANRIVRTEMAHLQTQAAQHRYKDYGLEYYEILGNEDNSCGNHSPDCAKLHGKRFKLKEMKVGENAPPFHPNCKCCIVPVVELKNFSQN